MRPPRRALTSQPRHLRRGDASRQRGAVRQLCDRRSSRSRHRSRLVLELGRARRWNLRPLRAPPPRRSRTTSPRSPGARTSRRLPMVETGRRRAPGPPARLRRLPRPAREVPPPPRGTHRGAPGRSGALRPDIPRSLSRRVRRVRSRRRDPQPAHMGSARRLHLLGKERRRDESRPETHRVNRARPCGPSVRERIRLGRGSRRLCRGSSTRGGARIEARTNEEPSPRGRRARQRATSVQAGRLDPLGAAP